MDGLFIIVVLDQGRRRWSCGIKIEDITSKNAFSVKEHFKQRPVDTLSNIMAHDKEVCVCVCGVCLCVRV